MDIGVLGNEGSWYVGELQTAARNRGHRCERIDFPRLRSDVKGGRTAISGDHLRASALDAVLVRTMPPGSLEQVVYRMDVLHELQSSGVIVMNPPRAVETAVDKFLTTARLAGAGLPTPQTVVCESSDQAIEAFESLGGDVVVKPIFGSEGRGILRVSDPDLAIRVFRTLERTQAVLYLQEFVPHAGFDVRVLVLDARVVGSVIRRSAGDFRTNVARQGVAETHIPTDLEAELSLRATAAVGACFAGVDLLYHPSGECQVIEVNAVPGWRAFQRATGIPVAERVIESLESRQHEQSG